MSRRRIASPSAFTLIELLIVVAIIAILAAIAVPNFLEAQTRSKVARAKSDMRSVHIALESYLVDTNKIPPDCGDRSRPPEYRNILAEAPGRKIDCVNPMSEYDTWKNWLQSRSFSHWTPLTTPIAYMTSIPIDPFSSWVPMAYETWEDDRNNYRIGFSAFFSWGPDRKIQISPIWDYPKAIYDPTNGTTSDGDILRIATVRDQDYLRRTAGGIMPSLNP